MHTAGLARYPLTKPLQTGAQVSITDGVFLGEGREGQATERKGGKPLQLRS